MVERWDLDKPHRCPRCWACAVVGRPRFRSLRVYTCCRCGTRFARWPRLARVLIWSPLLCGEHTEVETPMGHRHAAIRDMLAGRVTVSELAAAQGIRAPQDVADLQTKDPLTPAETAAFFTEIRREPDHGPT
ncbi:hypothetical protein [Allonocardiopsis opalescens]|uniref:Uncharacterized protein n=1 Tax=Allonocardiopsis opalescens TaxID=1144618 RepID=A0A2T0PSR3_9ACTN|nr:hypothetical protein [Allonocardiopsis opalescens]PRX91930.1 hypothetical protein CLV72_1123 [Allonocardiopsis opalescens]